MISPNPVSEPRDESVEVFPDYFCIADDPVVNITFHKDGWLLRPECKGRRLPMLSLMPILLRGDNLAFEESRSGVLGVVLAIT